MRFVRFMSKDKENKKMQQITIKLKVDDLNRLKDYADTKGGNPVSHYIREAVAEFLDNREKNIEGN
jgi:predicted DNA binding CopG/RHH family protein